MALNIKSDEADALARELARRRGESITAVIISALKAELDRERRSNRKPDLLERLRELGRRHSSLPIVDDRGDDEILGYDDMLDPP